MVPCSLQREMIGWRTLDDPVVIWTKHRNTRAHFASYNLAFLFDELEKIIIHSIFHFKYTNLGNVRIACAVSVSYHLVVSCSLRQQCVFAFGYRMLLLSPWPQSGPTVMKSMPRPNSGSRRTPKHLMRHGKSVSQQEVSAVSEQIYSISV